MEISIIKTVSNDDFFCQYSDIQVIYKHIITLLPFFIEMLQYDWL